MSQSSDIGPANTAGAPAGSAHWLDAVCSLLASRVALIQLEGKEAAHGWVRAAILFAAVGICVLLAWMLIVAGGVMLVAQATGWSWGWVAMGAAVLHLLIAIVCAKLAKGPEGPAFPVTRAEFEKDREWIENLRKPNKSGN